MKSIWKKQRMALISMAWTPSMVFTRREMTEKKTVDRTAKNRPRPGQLFGFPAAAVKQNTEQQKL